MNPNEIEPQYILYNSSASEAPSPLIIKTLKNKRQIKQQLLPLQLAPIHLKKKLTSKPILRSRTIHHFIREPKRIENEASHSPIPQHQKQKTQNLGHFLLSKLAKLSFWTHRPKKTTTRIKKEDKNQLASFLKSERKEEVRKAKPALSTNSSVKKTRQNKTLLPNSSYFTILVLCLHRLSKKYKRLKKHSLRLKKYSALQKKWKFRKMRKKIKQQTKQNQHLFFSINKKSLKVKTSPLIFFERERALNVDIQKNLVEPRVSASKFLD